LGRSASPFIMTTFPHSN